MSARANAQRRSESANSEQRAVMMGLRWPIAHMRVIVGIHALAEASPSASSQLDLVMPVRVT
jgi:hypothetical protein